MPAHHTLDEVTLEDVPRAEGVRLVLGGSIRGFFLDDCIDIAAGLTFRTVLSVFPGLLALVSLLSLLGQNLSGVMNLIEDARVALPDEVWRFVGPAVDVLLTAPSPGIGLVVGILTALWTASGYVKAFGRAMNHIYGVLEGRSVVKYQLQMFILTVIILVGVVLTLAVLFATGPVAARLGGLIGWENDAVQLWDTTKWLGVIALITMVVGVLYYATPNVTQPRRRILSLGAILSIVSSLAGSALFFWLVGRFGSFNAMYGTLAGAIIALWWLYIVNAILLFGGEVDAQRMRVKQLRKGIKADDGVQVELRDEKAIEQRRKDDDTAMMRAQRYRQAHTGEQQAVVDDT